MNPPCKTCKGRGDVTVKMRDPSGRQQFTFGICVCPSCMGKGHVTEEDRRRVQSVEMHEQIVS